MNDNLSKTLIDHVMVSCALADKLAISDSLLCDLSDHNLVLSAFKLKVPKNKVFQCQVRDKSGLTSDAIINALFTKLDNYDRETDVTTRADTLQSYIRQTIDESCSL